MHRVPRVIIETGLWVAQVSRNEEELAHHIVHRCGISMARRVFRIERLGHVQSIEPHLLWIDLLVPETTLGSSWLRGELLAQRVRCAHVARVVRAIEEREEYATFVDLVEIVLVRRVGE